MPRIALGTSINRDHVQTTDGPTEKRHPSEFLFVDISDRISHDTREKEGFKCGLVLTADDHSITLCSGEQGVVPLHLSFDAADDPRCRYGEL